MTLNNESEQFDAIVIGSGIGGLTTAALLSKLYGKKVLVLEQHFTVGGFTHSFERKGKFEWDVGLHYVGEMAKGEPFRKIFDYLTNGQLQWQKMPDLFEKFVYPDFTFDVYADPKKYQADLIQKFPEEKLGIRRYFRDVKTAATWLVLQGLLELLPVWLQPLLRKAVSSFSGIARQTTQAYLDQNFQDSKLKALLVSQWGDYGLPPAESSFGIHSMIVTHYFRGGWYPIGGSKEIAATILPAIQQSGGMVITQQKVTEILLEAGVAVGVKVQNTTKPANTTSYYAPVVISDAGVFNTYTKLIPAGHLTEMKSWIEDSPKGQSLTSIYLGLNQSPQSLGFQGENHWIYPDYDHNKISSEKFLAVGYYLSFPSLKNPLSRGHTADIIFKADHGDFAAWSDRSWRHRGEEYNTLKTKIIDSAIQLVESHYPGFQDLVEYAELSTPLTVKHFDLSDRGVVYGIPYIPDRFSQPWAASKTPIKNLYLTGADTFSPGVVGAMMGGVKAAGLVAGNFGFARIMATVMMS